MACHLVAIRSQSGRNQVAITWALMACHLVAIRSQSGRNQMGLDGMPPGRNQRQNQCSDQSVVEHSRSRLAGHMCMCGAWWCATHALHMRMHLARLDEEERGVLEMREAISMQSGRAAYLARLDEEERVRHLTHRDQVLAVGVTNLVHHIRESMPLCIVEGGRAHSERAIRVPSVLSESTQRGPSAIIVEGGREHS